MMIASLSGLPLHSVTPDRGKEFAVHRDVTRSLGVELYFAFPHHLRERGANENAKWLLREHFPRGKPIDGFGEEEVRAVYDELNRRPRKRLGCLTPYEVFHAASLHLRRRFARQNRLMEARIEQLHSFRYSLAESA